MLSLVLSCHKMDDNYGQHTCDSLASTGSPCVKQKITIHNLLNLGYNHKAIVFFHMFLPPTTNLLAYHDKGDLNIFSILVRCHDLYHKMGNVCRNGLFGDMLNKCAKLHRQPLFTLLLSNE